MQKETETNADVTENVNASAGRTVAFTTAGVLSEEDLESIAGGVKVTGSVTGGYSGGHPVATGTIDF